MLLVEESGQQQAEEVAEIGFSQEMHPVLKPTEGETVQVRYTAPYRIAMAVGPTATTMIPTTIEARPVQLNGPSETIYRQDRRPVHEEEG